MTWWLTKLIFQIEIGDGDHTPQFDEQFRIFMANSSSEAYEKSVAAGQCGETTFINIKSQPVVWRYLFTTEIYQLDEPVDGMEIYSRIEEQQPGEAYVYTQGLKAKNLQKQFVTGEPQYI